MREFTTVLALVALAACTETDTSSSIELDFPESTEHARALTDLQPTMSVAQDVVEEDVRPYGTPYPFFNEAGQLSYELGIGWGIHFDESDRVRTVDRGETEVRFPAYPTYKGHSRWFQINGRDYEAGHGVMQAFVDADERVWIEILAYANPDIPSTGFEVYSRQGELLFTIQRPRPTSFWDAKGDLVMVVMVPRSQQPETSTVRVYRLDRSRSEVLW